MAISKEKNDSKLVNYPKEWTEYIREIALESGYTNKNGEPVTMEVWNFAMKKFLEIRGKIR